MQFLVKVFAVLTVIVATVHANPVPGTFNADLVEVST